MLIWFISFPLLSWRNHAPWTPSHTPKKAPQRTGLAPQVTMRNSPPAWRRTSSPRWCRWASCLRSKWSPRQTWDLVWSYLEVISKFFVCCERLHSIFMIFILLRANIIWYSNLFAVRVIIPWRRFLAVIRYFFHWFAISKAKLDIVEVFKTSTGNVIVRANITYLFVGLKLLFSNTSRGSRKTSHCKMATNASLVCPCCQHTPKPYG